MATKKGLDYTAAQKRVIDAGWFALMGAVERSNLQEMRLKTILKSETKHFGPTSARAHIMEWVTKGVWSSSSDLSALACERDEKLIGFMVGVYLVNASDNAHPIILAMALAAAAWTEAHTSFLESLR